VVGEAGPAPAARPGGADEPGASLPPVARLSPELHERLVAWAESGRPNEACGILAGDRSAFDGGRALSFHPLTNAEASPFLYRIDPVEQLHAMLAIDDAEQVVWGIFHSHVASPAEPSVTDVNLAFYPDALYLICSLADPAAPRIRSWAIRGEQVSEVSLEVG
jgi:proteasome lid subunit RPN8/RPN11